MNYTIKLGAPDLIRVLLLVVIVGPIAAGYVFALMFPQESTEAVGFWMPFVWWFMVLTNPSTWSVTLGPTLLSGAILWAILNLLRLSFPVMLRTRLSAIASCLIGGAVSAYVAWELVCWLIHDPEWADISHQVGIRVIVPTGALVGTLLGFAIKRALTVDSIGTPDGARQSRR